MLSIFQLEIIFKIDLIIAASDDEAREKCKKYWFDADFGILPRCAVKHLVEVRRDTNIEDLSNIKT